MAFRFIPELSSQTMGMIVGGLCPALLYGASSIFAKVSANAGMSAGGHLIYTGIAVSTIGVLISMVIPGQAIATSAISASLLFGSLWALGSGCVVIALYRYEAALSKLAPLYNTNTLVAIVLSLIIFAEWQQVDLVKLLGGAVLIVLGGILVSLA
jgi:hypothetical protein